MISAPGTTMVSGWSIRYRVDWNAFFRDVPECRRCFCQILNNLCTIFSDSGGASLHLGFRHYSNNSRWNVPPVIDICKGINLVTALFYFGHFSCIHRNNIQWYCWYCCSRQTCHEPWVFVFNLAGNGAKFKWYRLVFISVLNPSHFGIDPDPRIRTTYLRILPFSSVADRRQQKTNFIFFLSILAY